MSRRAAGQDGDVPLFHHSAAEVPPPVPSGNHSHCGPKAGHDSPTQSVLHLRGPQAAQGPRLCRISVPQVGSKAAHASSAVRDRLFFFFSTIPPADATARRRRVASLGTWKIAGGQSSILTNGQTAVYLATATLHIAH